MDQQKLEVNIQISIRQSCMGGQGLQISESFSINSRSFIEIAKILGQFHDLAGTVKDAS